VQATWALDAEEKRNPTFTHCYLLLVLLAGGISLLGPGQQGSGG